MEKATANPDVDFYFTKAKNWSAELKKLRAICLESGLTEELKWGKPFYTFAEGNVLVIWGFKDHCALGFCKGALLKDSDRILSKIGENTQAVRKIRFTSVEEIIAMEPLVKASIREAIEVEKAGLEVTYKKTSEFIFPEEVKNKLAEDRALKKAFADLTPGRQRGYLLYFSAAKQSKTRASRVEKSRAKILAGKGLNDR